MLQARPSSATGIMSGHPQSQAGANQQYTANSQTHRNSYHGLPGNVAGQTSYRGIAAAGPVQPYAFTSTPTLGNGGQWQPYGALRTTSTPSVPTTQATSPSTPSRPQYQSYASMTNLPSSAKVSVQGMARDDSFLPSGTRQQGTSTSQPTFAQVASGKATPERYRRVAPRTATDLSSSNSSQPQPSSAGFTPGAGSAVPSGSGMATVVHLYNPRAMGQKMPIARNSATLASRPHSLYGYVPGMAADDMLIQRQPTEDELRRFRRRSMHSIDISDYPTPLTPQELKQQSEAARKAISSDKSQKPTPRVVPMPASSSVNNFNNTATSARNGSSESLVSSRSSNSRPSSVSTPIPIQSPRHCPISCQPSFLLALLMHCAILVCQSKSYCICPHNQPRLDC